MKVIEIIESWHWVNIKDGRTASIYGSVPYANDRDAINWRKELRGFTWRLDNGTVGLGRPPAKTRDEAKEVMKKINGR